MVIDFWFDVVCPYAWLASTRIEALAAEAGATVCWRPILLGGVLKALDVPTNPMAAMPEAKRVLQRLDIVRSAAAHGQPVTLPDDHPRRTLDAMRVLVSLPEDEVPAAAAVLFRAYWVEGVDVADRGALAGVLAPVGIDVDAVLADPGCKQRLRDATDEAVAAGVFGVPTFGLGERRWWGVDRLHFLRRALGLPDEAPLPTGADGPPLELFYDFASPFAYLGSTQAERMAADAGSALTATPILLGALFREIGTPMVPLFTFSEPRRRYQQQDLHEWAAWWGVPFRFPSTFPLRTVLPLRAAVVEPRIRDAVFRAAWAEDRDVGQPDVLRGVLDDAGFDGAALIEATERPEVKAALRANTERAIALGVMGVPTFRVGEELWWGQDRVPMVERALR
ncbi:MAG: 2-hydroxychromene-2-carboxylate isomerase [Alphaproteobacteria bacterium]|nr:2-hydroxychromene-2-carboxylate isomerase [Alphaproteobacteria bacterium]MCB9700123.1 2-hydroxychromene-2-carboxylate isomerase [Alphaproteobacteria bacterium]